MFIENVYQKVQLLFVYQIRKYVIYITINDSMLFIVSVLIVASTIHISGMKPYPLLVLDTPKSLDMAANQSELSELK